MSNNIGRTEVTDNQNQKEITINDSDGRIDAALTEFLDSDYTSADVELTDAQFQQNVRFNTTNLTVARALTFESLIKKLFIVDNTDGTATLTVTQGSTTIGLAAGDTGLYYTDGTTNGLVQVGGGGGGGASAFTDLTDTPSTFAANPGQFLKVNTGESALEFIEDPAGNTDVTDIDFDKVVFLCNMDGANGGTTFTDESYSGHTISVRGSATSATARKKFGTASLDTDAPASGLFAADSDDWDFDTGDWTIECFILRLNDGGNTAFEYFLAQWTTASSNRSWALVNDKPGGRIKLLISETGAATTYTMNGTATIDDDTWYHIAADYDGTTIRLYVDGVVVATQADGALHMFASNQEMSIGGRASHDLNFEGNIDEVRITKGVARYAGAFDPPVKPFVENLSGNASVFDLGVFVPGTTSNDQVMLNFIMTRDVEFPDDFAGSQFNSITNPAALTSIDIQKNEVNAGDISITTGGVATFTTDATTLSFAAGDRIAFIGQASADASLADFTINLKGIKS